MGNQYKAKRRQWDSQGIQALRRHLGLTQRELAERLGTRQQTISEWETGLYKPRGASATLLSIVAERAKFRYEAIPRENNDIAAFNLSTRTYNALWRSGISTVWQLSQFNEKKLLKIRNLGIKNLNEIRARIPHKYLSGLELPSRVHSIPEQRAQIVEASLMTQLKEQEAPLTKIGLHVLGLSVRANNALKNANIHSLQQLIYCTDQDLLTFNNIGLIRQNEIRSKLNSYLRTKLIAKDWDSEIIRINPYIDQLITLTNSLCAVFEKHKLLDNLLLPRQVREDLYQAIREEPETLADLKQIVESSKFQVETILSLEEANIIIGAFEFIIKWLNENLTYQSIDDEIKKLFLLSDRERFILINRHGIETHLTLEEIGNQLGITRERVRQIEEKVKKKLIYQDRRLPPYYSTAAIILLKRMGENVNLHSWSQHLINIGFLKDKLNADLILAIGKATNSSLLVLTEEVVEFLKTGISPRLLSADCTSIKTIYGRGKTESKNW